MDLSETPVTLNDLIGGEFLPGTNVSVFYRDLSGKTKCLEVGSEVTASALTELIAECEGVPAADLHLFHERSVNNTATLPSTSSLNMSMRVGGGMFNMFKKKPAPAAAPAPAPRPAAPVTPTVVEPDEKDLDELEALSREILKADRARNVLIDRYGKALATKDAVSQAIVEITQKIDDPKTDKKTKPNLEEQLVGVTKMLELVELMERLTLKKTEVVRFRRQAEEIRNLAEELAKIPTGSLRHLILRCIISLELQNTPVPELASNPVYSEVNIEHAVTVEIPELLTKYKLSLGSAYAKLLTINIATKNEEKLSNLRDLLKEIFPLNIQKLVRLFEKSKKAAGSMENRSVMLFVGATGAGKSTTIQFLSGCKMAKTEVKIDNSDAAVVHIASASDGGPESASVVSSPSSDSETNCINPISFPACRVWKDGDQNLIVTLCDAPGFGDTAGPEVDIANGLGIIEAMKKCSNVKLVVLFSYRALGDRNEGIAKLISMVLGMVDGITQFDKSRLNDVHFLYTKFPDAAAIGGALASVKSALVKNVGPSVAPTVPTLWVLDDMIEKANRRIHAINPLSDDPGKLLQELLVNGEGMDGSALLFSMTLESKTAVTKEATRELEILKTAMELKEFDLVLHHLENLRLLSELTKLDDARDSYKSALAYLVQYIADFCKGIATSFVKLMRSKDGISQEDFAAYKHATQVLKDAQVFRLYLQDALVHPSALSAEVNVALKELRSHTLNALPIDDSTIKTYLDNLKLIKDEFAEFSVQYDNDVKFIKTKLEGNDEVLKASLVAAMREHADEKKRKEQFANIAVICQGLFRAISNLAPHVDAEAYFVDKVKEVLETVEKLNASVGEVLDELRLTEENVDKLKDFVSIATCAKQTNKLQDVVDTYLLITKKARGNTVTKDLDSVHEGILAQILDWYNRYAEEAENLAKQNNAPLFDMKRALDSMKLLRKIPEIQARTGSSFFQITERINAIVKIVQDDAENLILEVERIAVGDATAGVYQKIHRSLNRLNENKAWIQASVHDAKACERVFDNVGTELKRHVDNLKRGLRFLDLHLRKPGNVIKAFAILDQIDRISVMAPLLPGLNEHINPIIASVVDKVHGEFTRIINQFSLPEFQNEEALLVLKKLERELAGLDPAAAFLRSKGFGNIKDVEEFIQEKANEKQESIRDLERRKAEATAEKSTIKAEDGDSEQQLKLRKLNGIISDCEDALNNTEVKFAGLTEMMRVREEFEALRTKTTKENWCTEEQLVLLKKHDLFSMDELQAKLQQLCEQGFANTISHDEKSFEYVDPVFTNSCLEYLEACQTGDEQTVQRSTDISNAVMRFLDTYGSHLDNKITKAFDEIKKERAAPSHGNELLAFSTTLDNSFQRLVDLTQVERVFLAVGGPLKMENYRQKFFVVYYQQLSSAMQHNHDEGLNERLAADIEVARALIVLDRFFPAYRDNNTSYSQLYNQYRIGLTKGMDQYFQDVMKCIDTGDINQLNVILQNYSQLQPRHLNQVRLELQRCLFNIAADALSTVKILHGKIDREDSYKPLERANLQVEQIVNAIAKPTLVELLNKEDVDRLQESLKDIKEALLNNITAGLSTVDTFLKLDFFDLAKRNLENINNVCSLLKSTVTDTTIPKTMNELNEKLYAAIIKVSEGNEFSDISKYSARPPKDVLEKLKTVKERGDANYTLAYDKLVEKVQNSLNTEVSKIQSAAAEMSIEERLREIDKIILCLNYVPEDLKTRYDTELQSVRKLLVQQQSEDESTVEKLQTSVLQGNDSDEQTMFTLQTAVKRFVESGSRKQLDSLMEQVCARLRNYHSRIIECCNKGTVNMDDALPLVKKLFKYKEAILAKYDSKAVVDIYSQAAAVVGKAFRTCCAVVEDMQNATKPDKVDIALTNMLRCLTYSNTFDTKLEVLLTNEDDRTKCKDALKRVRSVLSALTNPLSDDIGFDKLDIAQISNLAVDLHRWENIVVIVNNEEFQSPNLSIIRPKETEDMMVDMRNIAATVPAMSTLVARIQAKIVAATKHLTDIDFVRRDIAHSDRALKEHFEKIVVYLQRLHSLRRGLASLDLSSLDLDQTSAKWEGIIAAKLEKLGKDVVALATKIGNVKANTRVGKDCEDFMVLHLHVSTFSDVNKEGIDGRSIVPRCDISAYMADAERLILAKVQACKEEVNKCLRAPKDESRPSDIRQIADRFMDIKFLASELVMYTAIIVIDIDALLAKFKTERGVVGLTALSNVLSDHDLGHRLISEHNVLAGEKLRLQNEGMKDQDNLEYVKNALRGDHVDWATLEAKYKKFTDIYQATLNQCIERSAGNISEIPKTDILTRIKEIVKAMKPEAVLANKAVLQWTNNIKDRLPELIALISALWTLMKSEHFYQSRGMVGCEMYLIKPQTAQVMAMFRMLGIGYAREGRVGIPNHILIENNLIQIGTGEGKSVVLAVCASVFALMGMEVNVSCYSEYLTERDKLQFVDLFVQIGVDKLIEYGTFNKLCENLLNSQVNVRDAVLDMMLNNRATLTSSSGMGKSSVPKVLLIDEVDVFISDKYYGQDYLPSVTINDDTVKDFLDALWDLNKRQKINTMNIIKNSLKGPYEALMARFSNYSKLIEESIKDLVGALGAFRSSTWYVQNDKICYEYGESIVDTVHLGPDTVWAYYEEHDKKAISDESLRANVGISIKCGKFSYAEMPKEFVFISGVTGTLETLSNSDRSILHDIYNITKNTYMPSLYGGNKRKFNSREDVHILDSTHFFQKIREEIDMMRNAGRPVLIFFPTKETLNTFYNSPPMADLKLSDLTQITEETTVSLRQSLIDKSTAGAKVTLLTRTFGRGTDFICKNPQVKANGGVCVIQAFFSPELSEEVQIMGRCARQGEPGSFRIMMLDSDLEYFLGSQWKTEIEKIDFSKYYETMHVRRNLLYTTKCNGKKTRIDELKSQHADSKEFMQSIMTSNVAKCKEFLEVQNKGASLGIGFSRTLLLLDATGSMGGMISVAKDCVCTVFERASDTLKKSGLPSDNFKVQFAVYRDYDCGVNEILRTSAWHTDPSNLRVFMEGIRATGGDDWEEAIEIGLWHANQEASSEDGLSQIILIGDAPAKQAAVVAQYRNHYGGEGLWAGSRFGPATHFAAEAAKLRVKNIPIHTFFLTRGAVETNFKAIAGVEEAIPDTLKGRCEYLNIMDPQSTAQFTHFVTEEVLRISAGAKGNETVQLYQRNYKFTHTG